MGVLMNQENCHAKGELMNLEKYAKSVLINQEKYRVVGVLLNRERYCVMGILVNQKKYCIMGTLALTMTPHVAPVCARYPMTDTDGRNLLWTLLQQEKHANRVKG